MDSPLISHGSYVRLAIKQGEDTTVDMLWPFSPTIDSRPRQYGSLAAGVNEYKSVLYVSPRALPPDQLTHLLYLILKPVEVDRQLREVSVLLS